MKVNLKNAKLYKTIKIPRTVRRRGHGQAACLPTIPHTQALHRFCYSDTHFHSDIKWC